jgi:peptide deformylase
MTWDDFFADLNKRYERGIDVVPYPHPALRHPAVPVKEFGDGLKKLVAVMFEKLYERRGLGLAAPQLGLPLQVFVINHTTKQKEGVAETDYDKNKELVFVNPTIKFKEKRGRALNFNTDMEGCLSISGLFRAVTRPHTIMFEAFDADGKPFKGEYNGLMSRVVQHENDHLHARLFIDHLDEKNNDGVPGWLQYLCGQFEYLQSFKHFGTIEEEKEKLAMLEKLAGEEMKDEQAEAVEQNPVVPPASCPG